VEQLRQDREQYEETMKKAFMRGVCALNMEAMSMFHDSELKASGTSGERSLLNSGFIMNLYNIFMVYKLFIMKNVQL
jgi:centrosomal protein POC5